MAPSFRIGWEELLLNTDGFTVTLYFKIDGRTVTLFFNSTKIKIFSNVKRVKCCR